MKRRKFLKTVLGTTVALLIPLKGKAQGDTPDNTMQPDTVEATFTVKVGNDKPVTWKLGVHLAQDNPTGLRRVYFSKISKKRIKSLASAMQRSMELVADRKVRNLTIDL